MKLLRFIPFILVFLFSCQESREGIEDDDRPPERKTHSYRTKLYSPEEELAGFKVPDGFTVELVASERDGVMNPIDLTFDDAGRLWTQTAVMYPLDPVADIQWGNLLNLMDDPEAQRNNPAFQKALDLYEGRTPGKDKILILSNLYGDKIKSEVWAEGLAIPQSILPYKNGAYVAQGSELFFMEDSDGDGKGDTRKRLFTGFGITDSHTMAHQLIRGPGDWIHFSHGALNKGKVESLVSEASVRLDFSKLARFSLDGGKIEVINSGLNNIWGYQLRANGQWFASEANDLGYSVVPVEIGTGFPGIGGERLRPYQPWMPPLHDFRVGGTGISSLAFADDTNGSFGEEWKNVAFLANPITSTINSVKIVRNTDGTVSAEHLPDLLTSEDDWFRPVNMEFGPDGCLYIADWYNKIISHNELPTTHPDRDKSHGRIFRICASESKKRDIPDFRELSTDELPSHLLSESLWAKRAAWNQITDRPKEETVTLVPDLKAICENPTNNETTRILALWSLEGLNEFDLTLMESLLQSESADLKREAIRSLSSFKPNITTIEDLLGPLIKDPNPMIRSQVIRTLGEIEMSSGKTIGYLIQVCNPSLGKMGGSYEREFERFLARKVLEEYPDELLSFLESPASKNHEAANLLWGSQALGKANRAKYFKKFWPLIKDSKVDEPTFIIISDMLGDEEVFRLIDPVLSNKSNARHHVNLALINISKVRSSELANLLTEPVRHLIEGDDEMRTLGLRAAASLAISSVISSITDAIESGMNDESMQLAISALEIQRGVNQQIFQSVCENTSFNYQTRTISLHAIAKIDLSSAKQAMKQLTNEFHQTQLKSMVEILSNSPEGSELLKTAIEDNILNANHFNLSSAERIKNYSEDAVSMRIFSAVQERIESEKREFAQRLSKLTKFIESTKGNKENGKDLFAMCLQCHPVGNQGQNFAPALDGSANRDLESLLTAIINPDAALESSYAVYRVMKTDGGSTEGYLVSQDEKGTTIGFMGGSTSFIPIEDIRTQGFLPGRSFMLKGLIDNYEDQEIADLVEYILSLE